MHSEPVKQAAVHMTQLVRRFAWFVPFIPILSPVARWAVSMLVSVLSAANQHSLFLIERGLKERFPRCHTARYPFLPYRLVLIRGVNEHLNILHGHS